MEDTHPEAGGSAGDGPSDASEAHEAERRSVDVTSQVVVHLPPRPAAGAEVGLCVRSQPCCRQDQQEGDVRGRLVEHAGRVADGDAEIGGGADVDVVVSHCHIGHDPQPRRAGGQDLSVDAVSEHAHHSVEVADGSDELLVGPGNIVVALRELVTGVDEGVEPAGRQPAGDEDFGAQWSV